MPDITEAVANIRAALKGRVGKTLITVRTPDGEKVVPSYPLTAVVAGDVLAVAKSIPEDAHTELTGAVYLGAANNKPDATVYQEVRALTELLELADAAS